ncbi:MAG TPA: M50 family metallopeptidase [Bryobacteraceae bacterium]|nr:M50 family metallopeptidase [Bryobacteraceae bacterium]
MAGLIKILRWYFGIEALLFFVLPALVVWNAPPTGLLDPRGISAHALMRMWLALASFGGVQLALAAVFGMTWWTLPKAEISSRAWAIAASLLNVPMIFVGRPMWLSTAAGIVGLWVFSQPKALARIARTAAKIPRLPGDGTSRSLDMAAQLAMCGGVLAVWSWWSRWAEMRDLPRIDGLALLLNLVLASLISTTVHELGHVIAGWSFGMKVRVFVAGPFHWRFRNGRWEFKFHPTGLLLSGGAAALVPSSPDNRRCRDIVPIAAGPFASLLIGAIALWAALSASGHPWAQAWQLLALLATCSLLTFAMNLIPLRPESSYSDGARLYQLLSAGPWVDVYRAFSIAASSLVCALRPRDYDMEVIQRAAQFLTRGQQALVLRMYAYTHFFDSCRFSEAMRALTEAESVYAQGSPAISAEMCADFVFANAFLKRDAAAAHLWWDRMQSEKAPRFTVDYWKARSALLWIENDVEQARAAWDKGNELAQTLPHAGAYEFSRHCFAQLREVLDATPVFCAAGAS